MKEQIEQLLSRIETCCKKNGFLSVDEESEEITEKVSMHLKNAQAELKKLIKKK